MSILIKELHLPTERLYPLHLTIYSDGNVFCGHGIGKRTYEAVEVPIPHGKLGDFDVLIKRLEQQRAEVLSYLPEAHSREEGYTREDYIFDRNGDMISILRNQAAVIPAEEEA